MKIIIPQLLAIASTGLLAGAFMNGILNVVPTFYEEPSNVHLVFRTRLMHHNSLVMQFLMFASIVTLLWCTVVVRYASIVTGLFILSAALALTSLLVTRLGNVPINQLIKTWPPSNPPADWLFLLNKWNKYNLIRSLAAIGCFFALIVAVLYNIGQRY